MPLVLLPGFELTPPPAMYSKTADDFQKFFFPQKDYFV
jgi:hypothetical protein